MCIVHQSGIKHYSSRSTDIYKMYLNHLNFRTNSKIIIPNQEYLILDTRLTCFFYIIIT